MKRELKIFMMLPVWLMGIRGLWAECFAPLSDTLLRFWKNNGPRWVAIYLSEACRIIVLWVNGTPYVPSSDAVRVRLTRSGLPVFLPGPLRKIFHLLRSEDHAYALKVIRVTLSVLSVYRVIGCVPALKLETITGPFSGATATLLLWEVTKAVNMLPRLLVLGRFTWKFLSESSGPNHKKSTWSAGLDAVSFLLDPLTWFNWMVIAWSINRQFLLWNVLTVVLTLPFVPLILIVKKFPGRLGKLALLYEARGKVRVVAITDWWTQVLLKPLHKGLFDILRDIPQDGTFDQLAPVHRLIAYVRESGSPVFSYDLSAATDRLPIKLQIQVLEELGVAWARNWARLLVGRSWYLDSKPIKYAVGQPMGALSSWAILAVTHHLLVQIAARRVSYEGWFQHYALLGDDIIIADRAVAGAYLNLMTELGVTINLSKSFVIDSGGLEFAKRWFSPTLGDLSPIGPGLILACIRNPRMLSSLIQDALTRDYIFPTRVVTDLGKFLRIIRPRKWLEKWKKPIFSSVFGPNGGLWGTASGPYFKAIWIGLFPYTISSKFTQLVDILNQLMFESQTPPSTSEELKRELFHNLWSNLRSMGTNLRGAIMIPFLIISPSFWVYYDQLAGADAKVLNFQILLDEFEIGLYELEHLIIEGLRYKVRGEELRSLFKVTFDPGLLDWDRRRAELDLRMQISLYDRWSKRAAKILKSRAEAYVPEVLDLRGYTSTPSYLSLVPWGYRGHVVETKFQPRPLDIPQSGSLMRG